MLQVIRVHHTQGERLADLEIYKEVGTFCGGGGIPPPGIFINCPGGGSQSGSVGSNGTDGKLGGPSGAAIKRATNAFPYTLIGDNTDTMKGPENVG